jgi:protein-S-isoprenylcysteine O-methyltransferase Ste14
MTARNVRRWLGITTVVGGGELALSGGWTSPIVWMFVAGICGLMLYTMTRVAPGLADERFDPPTSGEDRIALRWIRITAIAAAVISPLDGGRFHWSPEIPAAARFAAMLGVLVAFGLCFHAMVVNRYFSSVIRIQDDRGHRVVDGGPYSVIRHPGYLGMITGVPLMAIGFGSWLGCAFACAYSLLILRRVTVEDRFLRGNLPGYPEYAARVTSRLVPGLW